MSKVFDVEQSIISKHLINIYNEKELDDNFSIIISIIL
jgi:hypothetical protein